MKKIMVLTLGIIFILLGLLGLFLPFLQGILFLIIGFIILSLYFPQVITILKKYLHKHPHLVEKIEKIEKKIKEFVGEI